ncbi:MAG TPA: GxxExxY protein [Thermomicrobiales bacterium]|jgi:GxxExxY protein
MDGNGDELTHQIIGAAIEVHKALGPGLLEAVYEACLAHELMLRGLSTERQKVLPVNYRGIELECGYRLDLVVENVVLVELKAVEKMNSLYDAQVISYLKLSNYNTGLLINFNVPYLTNGIKRFAN